MLIACWSQKGGVGTSLLAAALTVRLHLLGKRPLLIDLDPYKADMAALLQCADRPSVLDWPLLSGTRGVTREAVVCHPLGFHLMPGPPRLVAEGDVSRKLAEQLTEALAGGWRQSSEEGDSPAGAGPVVVDLASALRDSTLVFLDRADIVLSVVTPDLLAARSLYHFSQEMALLGLDGNRFQVVVNRCGGGAGIGSDDLADLLPFPVIGTLPSFPRLARAVNQGEAIRTLTGRNAYTRAVDSLWRRLSPRWR